MLGESFGGITARKVGGHVLAQPSSSFGAKGSISWGFAQIQSLVLKAGLDAFDVFAAQIIRGG